MSAGAARDPRLDALRGFALFGILLVNIQSYLSGAPNAIGYLAADANWADRAAYFVTASFAVGKFMPLFGMLFGAGFALLYDKLKATYTEPRALYRRRLVFLFVFGLLHGLFLYFGDITHSYAIAGFVLLLHADRNLAAVARATIGWWILATAWLLIAILPSIGVEPEASAQLIDTVQRNAADGVSLGYWAQWPIRAQMFMWQLQANFLGLPTVIALMMTGALAQRAGWLRDRDAPAWRQARRVGLALGLPAAVIYGVWSLEHPGLEENLAMPVVLLAVHAVSLTLSFFYAAVMLQRAPDWLVCWLAPAGRMPLTNYFLQSLVMAVLLSGWGFALGDSLGYFDLSALACTLFAMQALLSAWWLTHFPQGPLEALWRAWTYRGAIRSAAAE